MHASQHILLISGLPRAASTNTAVLWTVQADGLTAGDQSSVPNPSAKVKEAKP